MKKEHSAGNRHTLIYVLILLGNFTFLSLQSFSQVVYQQPINLQTRTVDQSRPVGLTSGSASVGDNGSANYTIPIYCPPGTNGMVPAISINYSSKSGYGCLGWGFDISGLSSISRVPRTPIQDGNWGAVDMTGNDKLAIDGNRMIMNQSGGMMLLVSLASYYTEYADFSTIDEYQYGTTSYTYFVATKPDGTKLEYGNTANSRALLADDGSGKPALWRINKMTDVNGNYITYEYSTTTGLITRIAYTGNVPSSLAPYNEILFTYSSRPDANVSYPAYSAPLTDNVLLTRIDIKCENVIFKSYTFTYEKTTSDNYSFLNEVTESNGGSTSLNSTVFTWSDKLSTTNVSATNDLSEDVYYEQNTGVISFVPRSCIKKEWKNVREGEKNVCKLVNSWDPKDQIVIVPGNWSEVTGDFNGDGYMDIVKARNEDDTPTRILWYVKLFDPSSQDYASPGVSGYIENSNGVDDISLIYVNTADFDGNGVDEVAFEIFDEGKTGTSGIDSVDYKLYNFTGTTLVPSGQNIKNLYARGIDFIGDAYLSYSDLDGDSKQDELVVYYMDTKTTYFYMNGFPVSTINPPILPTASLTLAPVTFLYRSYGYYSSIDFNGNGIPDVMWYQPIFNAKTIVGQRYTIYEFDGSSFAQIYTFQNTRALKDSIYPVDFNGDGKTDLLTMQQATKTWSLMLSKGNAFITTYPAPLIADLNAYSAQNTEYYSIVPGDYNGDGKTDIFLSIWSDENGHGNKIYYSYGSGFISNTPASVLPPLHNYDEPNDYQILPVGDMNGDGNDDLIANVYWWTSGARGYYSHLCRINENKHPYLIKTATNGYNQTTTFNYKPLGDASVHTPGNSTDVRISNYKGSEYVVSSVVQPDGIGGTSTTSYLYEGATVHKFGKGFLGFTKVISQNDISLEKVEKIYQLQTDYLDMNLVEQKGYINNTMVTRSLSTFGWFALSGSNNYGYYKGIFPYISETTETDYLSATTKNSSFSFGTTISEVNASKGNLRTLTELNGQPVYDLQVVTANTYTTTYYTTYHGSQSLCKPIQTSVTTTAQGQASYNKTIRYTYKTNSLPWTIVEFYGLPKAITTTFAYDGNTFGNVSRKTISASGMTSRYTDYGYAGDPKGRFVTTETNMLGHVVTYTYLAKYGQILTKRDIWNNLTSYTYDDFGNKLTEDLPGDLLNTHTYAWSFSPTFPNNVYYINTVSANAPDVRTIYDAFGRDLYSRWDGSADLVASNKYYNRKGQLVRETKPYYVSQGAVTGAMCYRYDVYGRIAKTKDSTNNMEIPKNYSYSGKTVTISDTLGRQTTKTVNNAGQVVSTTDPGGTISYTYFSNGQVKDITTNGAVISHVYDEYARLTSKTDPNAGGTTYTYTNFGELATQTDARLITYTMTYDNLGRIYTKVGLEGTYTYNYITTGNGKGLLGTLTGPGNYNQAFTYNVLGQVLTATEDLNGTPYVFTYTYDGLGNRNTITYPNSFAVKNVYNTLGDLSEVRRLSNNTLIWALVSKDAQGRPNTIEQGNGLMTDYTYDNFGFVTGINSDVQNDAYTWNKFTGNMMSRADNRYNMSETFTYDALDRLNEIWLNGNLFKTTNYADNGNISDKTDAGAYSYNPTKVHAISEIAPSAGSRISTNVQDITYTGFNKIRKINEGTDSLLYVYGPDMERRKMILERNDVLFMTRIYCGLYEKQLDANNNVTKEICYIAGTNGITAVNYNNTIYYLRRDHQGSITGLVNGSGVLVEEYSFDAWGSRRSPSNWANYTVSTPTYLYRGYTFHEHLDQFDLINMNGRAYDPVVGRFLSVDPVIQNGANTQNYNRYSYCLNNPLKYTDPSGYRWTGTDQENHNGNLARQASLRQIKSDLENWRTNQILGSVKIVGCAMPKPVGNNADGDGVRLGSDLIAQMISVIGKNCIALKPLLGGNSISRSGNVESSSDGQPDGDPTVVNLSKEWVYVLTDCNENYQIIAISPKGSYYGAIDGVATFKYDKFVYKVPTNGSVTILEDGDVDLDLNGLGDFIAGTGLRSGWKDIYYFNNWDLTHNGWGDLFDSLKTY